MLYLMYSLNALLMIALPILLGLILARRLGQKWSLFGVGALVFIGSQAVHLPLNALLAAPITAASLPLQAVALGLTAGLSEELARYAAYRWWIKSARTWRQGLMFGAGHGGIEAVIFGLLAGVVFIQLAFLRQTDLSTLPLTAEQLEALTQQMDTVWSAPWYAAVLGAVERVFALCLHLSLSLLVLQVFRRRNLWWLLVAIVWHAAVNAAAVWAVQTWGVYWTEAIVGGFALASLALIFVLRQGDEIESPALLVPEGADAEETNGASATL